MDEQQPIQVTEAPEAEHPKRRNWETLGIFCLMAFIWMIPFISKSQVGGLYGGITLVAGLISAVIGLLILFFPLRFLVRRSMGERRTILPRIALLLIFALLIAFAAVSFTPGYIKIMEREANLYYDEHPEEFENPFEHKAIHIEIFNGPYETFFLYTEDTPPKHPTGGILIDYQNGWYFFGQFLPI